MPDELLGLEAKIRELAARGELTHFSIVPVAGKGPNGCVWSASYCPASKWGAGFGRDADPVKAAMMAFEDMRLPKRVQYFKENGDPDAAVIVKALDEGTPVPPDADAKLTAAVKRRAAKAAAKANVVDDSDFL